MGAFQTVRGNLYGATAFLVFGNFWFSNGLSQVLKQFGITESTPAATLIGDQDAWGTCFRSLFMLAFSLALLKQTFVMNKLSTSLISLLCLKIGCAAFAGWSKAAQWSQFVFGWLTTMMAFYIFFVEFTNQVYKREVFKTYKWSEDHSPEEVFGATGRGLGTLFSKAVQLRQASSHTNIRRLVREASVVHSSPSERSGKKSV